MVEQFAQLPHYNHLIYHRQLLRFKKRVLETFIIRLAETWIAITREVSFSDSRGYSHTVSANNNSSIIFLA